MLGSPKIDGIRCLLTLDGPILRSGKQIPNVHIRETLHRFKKELHGLDGEIIAGDNPGAYGLFGKTTSLVRNYEKEAPWSFWVFDDHRVTGPFYQRLMRLADRQFPDFIRLLVHRELPDPIQVGVYERRVLKDGFEGVVLRNPNGLYKNGRITLREENAWKLKSFSDHEAEVIGMVPLLHNGNEAFKGEMGQTKRSKVRDGLIQSLELMGALICVDLETQVEFQVGSGFTEEQRRWWFVNWDKRQHIITYKKMAHGEKDKPRHPIYKTIFKGRRLKEDM